MRKGDLNQLKEMYWDYDYPASAENIYEFIKYITNKEMREDYEYVKRVLDRVL